jgi:hypothetical protein
MLIDNIADLLKYKRREDEQKDWDMKDVHYKVLVWICSMGISSLEMAVYGYKVNAKYLQEAAWDEIGRRLKLCEPFIHAPKIPDDDPHQVLWRKGAEHNDED